MPHMLLKAELEILNFTGRSFRDRYFQQLQRIFPKEFTLNFLICVREHLHKHTGENYIGKEFVLRVSEYSLTITPLRHTLCQIAR